MRANNVNRNHNWLAVSGGICVLAVTLCWFQRRNARSAQQTLQITTANLATMSANAQAIRRLSAAPRQASEHQLPHDQLVALVGQAMEKAALPSHLLSSVWPDPARRIPNQDYLEMNTRLQFDGVKLEQFVPFVHYLQELDSSVRTSALRLLSGQNASDSWDAELTVSYLIYAPRDG